VIHSLIILYFISFFAYILVLKIHVNMSQLKNKRYEGLIQILPGLIMHDLVLYLILLNNFTDTS